MSERLIDAISNEIDDETKDLIIRAFRNGLFQNPSLVEELKFTITGSIFVPDDAEYEYNFENQIYSFKVKDKTYVLIAGLEADEKEIIVSDENFKSHDIGFFEYEDAYFED